MCLDVESCRWVSHNGKHRAPPSLKNAPMPEIDRATESGRPSLFYPGVDQFEIERNVLMEGMYVESGKPATKQKIMELDNHIGASDGQPSRWVMVEATSGDFHGRPITRALYERKLRRQKECCDGR